MQEPRKFPHRVESTFALADLPWFDLRDGRLVVADESVGSTIDVHTHLALAYLLPNRIDLHREWPDTEHYLPMERALDLDVYVNRNFSDADLSRMRKDLSVGSLTAAGMRRTHTLANLGREMTDLGIVGSCLLPIDFPLLSRNAETWLDAAEGRSEFIGFGSVHPYAPNVERRLADQIALGAKGIKVHPAVQTVLPSDPRAIRLYHLCGRHDLPVLFHCGPVDIEPWLGRQLSQVRHYARPIEQCPDTTFILGHSGALQMELARHLAELHENVYLEISSQSVGNIRRILERVDPNRILFGSDWPFYHQAIPLAKVLMATEGQEDLRAKVLYENAACLFGVTAQS